jgi:hypothetical protein
MMEGLDAQFVTFFEQGPEISIIANLSQAIARAHKFGSYVERASDSKCFQNAASDHVRGPRKIVESE